MAALETRVSRLEHAIERTATKSDIADLKERLEDFAVVMDTNTEEFTKTVDTNVANVMERFSETNGLIIQVLEKLVESEKNIGYHRRILFALAKHTGVDLSTLEE